MIPRGKCFSGSRVRSVSSCEQARVNLHTKGKAFRKVHNDISHDEICIFVLFMHEFQKHTTAQQMADLITKHSKGYLDKELNEKARVQDSALTVFDFRFLSMITGKQLKVSGPGSATLEERAEDIEVQQFREKLKKETELYVMYKRQLQISHAQTRRQKCEDNQTQEKLITDFSDSWCSTAALDPPTGANPWTFGP